MSPPSPAQKGHKNVAGPLCSIRSPVAYRIHERSAETFRWRSFVCACASPFFHYYHYKRSTESDIDAEHLREHLAAHGWERDEVTGHYRCQKCADFARAFSGSCASAVSSVSAID